MGRPASASLRSHARSLTAGKEKISLDCHKLLEVLRERCPDLIPKDPLSPGQVGPEVPLHPGDFEELARTAARSGEADSLLWEDGDNELLVDAGKISVEVGQGQVVVTIPVRCDQASSALVQVPFAVGDEGRPAGLVAVTQTRPRGPGAVVDVWGEALTAFAWQTLLKTLAAVAEESGRDLDGAGLVPAALVASGQGVKILTMARHSFDRVPARRVPR